MKIHALAALAAVVMTAAPAVAQDAPAAAAQAVSIRTGMLVFSSDNRRIGRVEVVVGDKNAPTAVKVIKDQRMVTIPASTLSAGDTASRLKTTLAYRDAK